MDNRVGTDHGSGGWAGKGRALGEKLGNMQMNNNNKK